jgi:hypothetical protein
MSRYISAWVSPRSESTLTLLLRPARIGNRQGVGVDTVVLVGKKLNERLLPVISDLVYTVRDVFAARVEVDVRQDAPRAVLLLLCEVVTARTVLFGNLQCLYRRRRSWNGGPVSGQVVRRVHAEWAELKLLRIY